MDKLASVVFVKSPITEAERLIQVCFQVVHGFYKSKGFLVLPDLVSGSMAEIVLPKVNYHGVTGLWDYLLNKTKVGIPVTADKSIVKKLEGLIIQNNLYTKSTNKIKSLEAKWTHSSADIWEVLSDAGFPVSQISHIEVRVTSFGSISSWSLDRKTGKLLCYLREDAGVGNIVKAIVMSLMDHTPKYSYSWEQRMAISDFLLTKTKLGRILGDYKEVVPSLVTVDKKLRNESKKYLSSLNFPLKENVVELNGRQIVISGRDVGKLLSRSEKDILIELARNKGEVVSFDKVADILWGEDDYKSLWAVNKSVQRLRVKLNSNWGLPISSLKTLRKRGYVYSEI